MTKIWVFCRPESTHPNLPPFVFHRACPCRRRSPAPTPAGQLRTRAAATGPAAAGTARSVQRGMAGGQSVVASAEAHTEAPTARCQLARSMQDSQLGRQRHATARTCSRPSSVFSWPAIQGSFSSPGAIPCKRHGNDRPAHGPADQLAGARDYMQRLAMAGAHGMRQCSDWSQSIGPSQAAALPAGSAAPGRPLCPPQTCPYTSGLPSPGCKLDGEGRDIPRNRLSCT